MTDHSTTKSSRAPLTHAVLSKAAVLTLASLTALASTGLAQTAVLSKFATPTPTYEELFYDGTSTGQDGIVANATVVAEESFADGKLFFMSLPDSQVGIVARGALALRTVNIWMGNYDATALEVFAAVGGALRDAPAALWRDHETQVRLQTRSSSTPRSLPSLHDVFSGGMTNTPGGAWNDDWFADSSACGDEDLGLFWFWFQYHDYDVWGAQGKAGHGDWVGEANIALGPSSSGVIAVCQFDGQLADLDIVEYMPGIGWVHIMDIPNFGAFAYGYIFSGYLIRNVRMTVRDSDDAVFFWAASY
jgi:hypothetical protein